MEPPRTKILHIVGRMSHGGVESWLMNVLRNIDRSQYQTDFLVHSDIPGAYEDKILELGGRILRCPHTKNPVRYARRFRQLWNRFGPYDVVHSHVHHFSGFTLACAWALGAPTRIAQSHSDTRAMQRDANLFRRSYFALSRRLIRLFATIGLAPTQGAALSIFDSNYLDTERYHPLVYGIPIDSFKTGFDRSGVRDELGVSEDSYVVGHVGRFAPSKNHEFILRVADIVKQRDPNCHFVLVGDGPDFGSIRTKVEQLGLEQSVTLTGIRDDIPRIMLSAFDLFILPSRREGLPLVAVEAQAAGLPCILSDIVAPVVAVSGSVVYFLPTVKPEQWADAIQSIRTSDDTRSEKPWLLVENSEFGIGANVSLLERIYNGRE